MGERLGPVQGFLGGPGLGSWLFLVLEAEKGRNQAPAPVPAKDTALLALDFRFLTSGTVRGYILKLLNLC